MWASAQIDARERRNIVLALRRLAVGKHFKTAKVTPTSDGSAFLVGKVEWIDKHEKARLKADGCIISVVLYFKPFHKPGEPSIRNIDEIDVDEHSFSATVTCIPRHSMPAPKLRSARTEEAADLVLLQGAANGIEAGYAPVSPPVLRQIRSKLIEGGEMNAARALLQAALPLAPICHETVQLRVSLGELCEALQDWNGAIRSYRSLTIQCAHMLGPALLRNQGRAETRYPACCRIEAYDYLGLAYKRSGRYAHAERMYREGLRGVAANSELHEHSLRQAQNLRWNLLIMLHTLSADYRKVAQVVLDLLGGGPEVTRQLTENVSYAPGAEIDLALEAGPEVGGGTGETVCARLTIDGELQARCMVLNRGESKPFLVASEAERAKIVASAARIAPEGGEILSHLNGITSGSDSKPRHIH